MLEKVPWQVLSLIRDAFLFHIPLVDSQAADKNLPLMASAAVFKQENTLPGSQA